MKTTEKSRLEARVTSQQKKVFLRAAALSGMSLSDFVKSALLEKANRILSEHDVIRLCLEDQEQLADHLLNPPSTPAKFKKLMAWRKQQDGQA